MEFADGENFRGLFPSTMCKNVMAENASVKEIDLITAVDSIPAIPKKG